MSLNNIIINLTQHAATGEQLDAGVVDLCGVEAEALRALLTFEALPSAAEIAGRAELLAGLAELNGLGEPEGDDPFPFAAMIGGAPYLMAALEQALLTRGIMPVYAFSVRETEEQPQPDGSVRKVAIFRHAGFVRIA